MDNGTDKDRALAEVSRQIKATERRLEAIKSEIKKLEEEQEDVHVLLMRARVAQDRFFNAIDHAEKLVRRLDPLHGTVKPAKATGSHIGAALVGREKEQTVFHVEDGIALVIKRYNQLESDIEAKRGESRRTDVALSDLHYQYNAIKGRP